MFGTISDQVFDKFRAYDDFQKEVWVIREFVDGADLEALMKNPSFCPALRSPKKRMTLAVGICKGKPYTLWNKSFNSEKFNQFLFHQK